MLNKIDVDCRSADQGTREHRDEFSDLPHSYSHSIVYVIATFMRPASLHARPTRERGRFDRAE
jgi:hypothetical protein